MSKGRMDCDVRIKSEVPICTNRYGVHALIVAVVLGFASVGMHVPRAEAQATTKHVATKTITRRTTKGVRTTAYRKRRPRVTVAHAAQVSVSLPLPAQSSDPGAAIEFIQTAQKLVGSRYVYGGSSPKGFDCTGLVHYVYGDKAANLPRSAAAMYLSIPKVTDQLRPGDIVFFGRGHVRHAAIYAGNGKLIHASTPRSGVRYDSLATLVNALGYRGAGRVI